MKKTLGGIFTLIGAIGVIYGVVMLFNGNVASSNTWIAAVLGLIFFGSGIGLLKSIRTIETDA